jgi:ubiquinone/menaquinone biosynthesis C-methylase UbiE
MLDNDIIAMLINPYNYQPVHFEKIDDTEFLVDDSGNKVPVIDGIPNFLFLEKTEGLNNKYQKFYDRISKLNDIAEFIYSVFIDLDKLRKEWMADVEVKDGAKVLETSIGTGWNVKVLPVNALFFGLDISRGMLSACKKNAKKWKRPMELFQGNAEFLPFKSESFDSVFHVGGINFFNDRQRGVTEMIRVAKAGTKIVIIDETEKRVADQYRKMPFVKGYFTEKDVERSRLIAPVDLVPSDMREIRTKLIDNGKMYQLSFRKP